MIGPLHLHQVLTHRGYNPLFGEAVLDEIPEVEEKLGGANSDANDLLEKKPVNPKPFVKFERLPQKNPEYVNVSTIQRESGPLERDSLGDDVDDKRSVPPRTHSDAFLGTVAPAMQLPPSNGRSDREHQRHHLTDFALEDLIVMGVMIDE